VKLNASGDLDYLNIFHLRIQLIKSYQSVTDEPLSPLIAWEFLPISNAHTATKKNEVPRKDKNKHYIRPHQASGTYTFLKK